MNNSSFLKEYSLIRQKQPPRGVLTNRCSENMHKFTREHPCRSVISIKLQSNIIEITLPHGCSPVNLLHIFRTPFPRNTSGWLLLIRRSTLYLSQIHKNCESQWQNDLISVKVNFNVVIISLNTKVIEFS